MTNMPKLITLVSAQKKLNIYIYLVFSFVSMVTKKFYLSHMSFYLAVLFSIFLTIFDY